MRIFSHDERYKIIKMVTEAAKDENVFSVEEHLASIDRVMFDLCIKKLTEVSERLYVAEHGWYDRYPSRIWLYGRKYTGETMSIITIGKVKDSKEKVYGQIKP